MHRSTFVSYCYLGRTPSASTVQLLTGGERADVREVEVLDRLKAASGPRYGLGTCRDMPVLWFVVKCWLAGAG